MLLNHVDRIFRNHGARIGPSKNLKTFRVMMGDDSMMNLVKPSWLNIVFFRLITAYIANYIDHIQDHLHSTRESYREMETQVHS